MDGCNEQNEAATEGSTLETQVTVEDVRGTGV